MESGLAPATANLMLAALRGVARLPGGRSATGGELAALLAACGRDPGPLGARDGAILTLLYGGGLRRAEEGRQGAIGPDPTGRGGRR